jgi:hypothetical protein
MSRSGFQHDSLIVSVDLIEKFRQAVVSGIFRVSITALLSAPLVAGAVGAWSIYSNGLNKESAYRDIEANGINTIATVLEKT